MGVRSRHDNFHNMNSYYMQYIIVPIMIEIILYWETYDRFWYYITCHSPMLAPPGHTQNVAYVTLITSTRVVFVRPVVETRNGEDLWDLISILRGNELC